MSDFRAEIRAWLEENCPESMRTPMPADEYPGGGRRAQPDEPTTTTTRVEPHLAEDAWLESHDDEDQTSGTVAESHAGPAERSEVSAEAGSEASQRILALHVRAAAGEAFSGPQLEQAFAAERLEFGLYDAYHFKTDSGQTAFTVVSMVEPGTFPADGMEDFATPGLTMFMLLSAADGVGSLSRMVACARRLASRLDAVCR